jgi:hypothetical protein
MLLSFYETHKDYGDRGRKGGRGDGGRGRGRGRGGGRGGNGGGDGAAIGFSWLIRQPVLQSGSFKAQVGALQKFHYQHDIFG